MLQKAQDEGCGDDLITVPSVPTKIDFSDSSALISYIRMGPHCMGLGLGLIHREGEFKILMTLC